MNEWKSELDDFFNERTNEKTKKDLNTVSEKISRFIAEIVLSAFQDLQIELEKYERKVNISSSKMKGSIRVEFNDTQEFLYHIKFRVKGNNIQPYCEYFFNALGESYRSIEPLRGDAQKYTIDDLSKYDILNNFLSSYKGKIR